MFVYTQRRGEATDLVACSEDRERLREVMRLDLEEFIAEMFGGDWRDDEDLEWLTRPENATDYWSDEDDEYETVFAITEVTEI